MASAVGTRSSAVERRLELAQRVYVERLLARRRIAGLRNSTISDRQRGACSFMRAE